MIKAGTYLSHSVDETSAFGRKIAASLRGGEVLALYGDLGTGKTAFVQGLAAGLGVKQVVNSPTYTIMNIYSVKNKIIKCLCHIDTYRLGAADGLTDIGAIDYIGAPDTVTAIEWAEKAEELLPNKTVRIYFQPQSENIRQIIIK